MLTYPMILFSIALVQPDIHKSDRWVSVSVFVTQVAGGRGKTYAQSQRLEVCALFVEPGSLCENGQFECFTGESETVCYHAVR